MLAPAALTLLVVWGFFPVVLLIVHASRTGARFTGADGLIGADGVLGADQLQYLAWARDAGAHGAAADLFTLGPSGHVYVEPLAELIGALSAIGVSAIVGVMAAKLVAAGVLAGAALAWARRLLPGRPGRQAAALALSLLLSTPVAGIVDWAQSAHPGDRFAAYLLGDELSTATKLWGYLPAALGVALEPLCLLALERALAGRRVSRALAALAAGLAAWLHPWQGATLVLILLGLAVWRRRREEAETLLVVAASALLPLAYYAVLPHVDPAWRLAAHLEDVARLPAWVLVAGLGPLLAIALVGVRRTGGVLAEQALLLWIPAALIVYFGVDAFPTHALEGIALPFGVLAVRAGDRVGRRLSAHRAVRGACAGVAVLALTVPVAAYGARKFVRVTGAGLVQYELPHSDVRVLDWVARRAPAGGILAPTPFAAVVPSQTGRHVWVGHGDWSPRYAARSTAVDRFFADQLSPAAARRFVAATGARILLADCARPDAGAAIVALGRRVVADRRFGCARVAVLSSSQMRARR